MAAMVAVCSDNKFSFQVAFVVAYHDKEWEKKVINMTA